MIQKPFTFVLPQPSLAPITPQKQEDESHTLFQVIPSRTHDPNQTEETLQAAMQSIVLDAQRPIALEIVGIGEHGAKCFLIRATDQEALAHAKAQIRAYSPQVLIRSLNQDPLMVLPEESLSAIELRAGASAYLPMKEMKETDPVRAILASLSLPTDMRAIAQITLIPATSLWSQKNLRKTVEHPLEKERQKRQDALSMAKRGPIPSVAGLLFFLLLFLGLILFYQFPQLLPAWYLSALTSLLFSGQLPHLLFWENIIFYGSLLSVLIAPCILMILVSLCKKFFGPSIYDQLQVARKTGQMAYRARIYLYAIGPGPRRSMRALVWRYTLLIALAMKCKIILIMHWMSPYPKPRRKLQPAHPGKILWRGISSWKQEKLWRQSQRQRRTHLLGSLAAAYRQFDTASAGYFRPQHMSDATAVALTRDWQKKTIASKHYITADFLQRAWYLPKDTMFDLPGIEQKRARTLLIPACLIARPDQQSIGRSRHAGYAFPFALPENFLEQHSLIGGKTGEGKSTLMIHIALQAIKKGALFLIDPHGDFALDVLRSIPPERWDDTVFIDLGDPHFSVGLNPLDVTMGKDRDITVAAITEAFRNVWESGWGSRMEAPFRSALMTLFEANETLVRDGKASEQYTILDVVQLLLDESFCHDVLASVTDIYLHRFWFLYYNTLDYRQQRERIDPVLTKMFQFESKVARRILGQSISTINLSQCVRERKIIVLRLANSESGLAAPVLGATMLSLLMTSLREQSILAPENRIRMNIIIDEFQSIPGADYAQLLAELRKFGGAATLATQSFDYLSKISPHLQSTTLANVKQYFLFRLSADDARLIARELGDVTEEDILNLDSYSCYVKLIHNLSQQPIFSVHIDPPTIYERNVIDYIRTASRRYSRLASEIEEDLFNSLARALQNWEHPRGPHKGDPMKKSTVDSSIAANVPSSPSKQDNPRFQKRSTGIKFSKRTKIVPADTQDDDLISSFDIIPEEKE